MALRLRRAIVSPSGAVLSTARALSYATAIHLVRASHVIVRALPLVLASSHTLLRNEVNAEGQWHNCPRLHTFVRAAMVSSTFSSPVTQFCRAWNISSWMRERPVAYQGWWKASKIYTIAVETRPYDKDLQYTHLINDSIGVAVVGPSLHTAVSVRCSEDMLARKLT